jgi:hypothetical protein
MVQTMSDAPGLPAAVEKRGFTVIEQAVPLEAVDVALRHIHLDLLQRGASAEALGSWTWSAHWFPHLRWDPPIVALAWHLPEELREGEMCDPQIVLQPPDTGEPPELVAHVDQEPPWANGRGYRAIIGVALSAARSDNGGLIVWPFDRDATENVELAPGDAVVMHPRLPHSSGFNRRGDIRYAAYFRFLHRT